MAETLPQGEEKAHMVQKMFDRIAPRYDAMNSLLTFGMDQSWRRKVLQAVDVGPSDVVLDIACGTGDLTRLSASRGATVIGLDFSKAMLDRARARSSNATFIRANAEYIPLSDSSVSVAVSGFSLRNFANLKAIFKEIARVLTPSGRFALLEVYQPQREPIRSCHAFYFSKVVPLLGALFSEKNAYSYLPRSVCYLPSDAQLLGLLKEAGFSRVQQELLFFGSAQLITAIRE
jgi:demethylmenaquinone methyltransferase / 2-methoxy-6-polyprenyl-1,4-benzoquinol methylase